MILRKTAKNNKNYTQKKSIEDSRLMYKIHNLHEIQSDIKIKRVKKSKILQTDRRKIVKHDVNSFCKKTILT